VHSPQSRLIAASSAAVYGSGHSGPISEQGALMPVSPYGRHKLMMEQLCRSYALSYGIGSTVVRLFSVYGEGLRKQLLWDVCSRLQENSGELVLGGTGEEVRDWCDVRDVVRLLAMLAQLPQAEPLRLINGGSGQAMRVSEVASLLAGHWGKVSVRFSGTVRAGDPFSLLADDAALRAMGFAWHVRPAQGIADYVRWFRDRARG
jgi:UDP-glucose 4-epimerase